MNINPSSATKASRAAMPALRRAKKILSLVESSWNLGSVSSWSVSGSSWSVSGSSWSVSAGVGVACGWEVSRKLMG